MNSEKLYRKINDNYEVVKYFCGKCGTIFNDKEDADKCCASVTCSICGREIPQEKGNRQFHYINPIRCIECYQKEKEDKMPIVENYNGEPLYDGSDFFSDLDNYIECFYGTEEDIPDWLEVCDYIPVPKIDSYDIVQGLIEECNLEDNDSLYVDESELHNFIREWNDKQTATLWEPSGKKLLITDEIRKELLDLINK